MKNPKLPKQKSIVKQFLKQERGETRPKIIKKMDALFSKEIKKRYQGICIKCGKVKPRAGVTHYFGRKYISTRWDFKNCQWACFSCHTFGKECLEHNKGYGEWYWGYMLKELGEKGFGDLNMKAHADTKWPTSDLKILLLEFEKENFV